VKKAVWDGAFFRGTTASSFVAKVRGEVFTHFHSVVVTRQSSMQNSTNSLWTIPLMSRLFRSPWGWTLPLGGLLLCLSVISANPTLVTSDNPGQVGCIVGGDLMKLLADVDTVASD
jgi:hypothetical protein